MIYVITKGAATRPIFSIAENYRYEPAMQHAANAVASGQIGKIR